MDLRAKQFVDKYLGGVAILVLRPVTMALGFLLRRNHLLVLQGELAWIKLVGGGSLLLAMPLLLGMRKKMPGVRFVLVTTPSVRPFAELIGVFDEYQVIEDRGVFRLTASAIRVLVRSFRIDTVVDLEVYSRLSTVFSTLTMARNRISFWLEDIFWRRGLASHLVFFNRFSGAFYFYERIAELYSCQVAGQEECLAVLTRQVGPVPTKNPGRICIGFSCSELGKERMLTAEQWVQVFRKNPRPNFAEFVFLGVASERPIAELIMDKIRMQFPQLKLINKAGELSLKESVALLLGYTEFWGIDSGLLHLARIGSLKTISFWGPTAPQTRLRSDWRTNDEVYYKKIACSPCVHVSEEPPCRGDNRCIQGLFSDSDFSAWSPIEYPKDRIARNNGKPSCGNS